MLSSTLLDELGYVPLDKAGADLLFGFISQRYERRSLVVTTNLPFARWSEVFLDPTARQADDVLRPFREAADRLTTMPGVSETVARVLIAEVGVDMTRFPGPGHLVSWAGLCPRLDESAGKRRSTRIRHATPWLKTVLVQAAWAAARKNGSYLQSQFRRLKGRRGPKKTIGAVAASMLIAAYYMLRDETDYHDLGGRYLAGRDKHRVASASSGVCTTSAWRSK